MICGDAMNSTQRLQNITGTIVLAGAGKMGGAMLTGWLAQGLDPARVAVIEPQPRRDQRAGGKRRPPQSFGPGISAPSIRWWSR